LPPHKRGALKEASDAPPCGKGVRGHRNFSTGNADLLAIESNCGYDWSPDEEKEHKGVYT